MRCAELEQAFENLANSGYHQFPLSPKTRGRKGYNCIAFAAGDQSQRWWPSFDRSFYYWPPHLSREPYNQETMANFVKAFESLGYRECSSPEFKPGIEKIALYADENNVPKHAARQLESGRWASKCGNEEDIEHPELAAVEGTIYGNAILFMHRRRDGKSFMKDRIRSVFRRLF